MNSRQQSGTTQNATMCSWVKALGGVWGLVCHCCCCSVCNKHSLEPACDSLALADEPVVQLLVLHLKLQQLPLQELCTMQCFCHYSCTLPQLTVTSHAWTSVLLTTLCYAAVVFYTNKVFEVSQCSRTACCVAKKPSSRCTVANAVVAQHT
jgi:hypothetical protein